MKNGYAYMGIHKEINYLLQAIMLDKLLKKHLTKHRYYEVPFMPRLWKHISQPIQFTLVVGAIGIKYIAEGYVNQFLKALQQDSMAHRD